MGCTDWQNVQRRVVPFAFVPAATHVALYFDLRQWTSSGHKVLLLQVTVVCVRYKRSHRLNYGVEFG